MANWSTSSVKTDYVVGNQIKNVNTIKEELVGEISTANYGDDLVLGINDTKLKATVDKLTLINSKTTKLFDDLKEVIEGVNYFNCSATEILNKALNDISSNIPTIENNATSYIDDLNLVIKGFGVISFTKVAMLSKARNNIPKLKTYVEKEK